MKKWRRGREKQKCMLTFWPSASCSLFPCFKVKKMLDIFHDLQLPGWHWKYFEAALNLFFTTACGDEKAAWVHFGKYFNVLNSRQCFFCRGKVILLLLIYNCKEYYDTLTKICFVQEMYNNKFQNTR